MAEAVTARQSRIFLLLFFVSAVLYATAVGTFIVIFDDALWHPSLLRFASIVWNSFLHDQGSSGRGFISGILISLLTIVFTIMFIGILQGLAAMKEHVWQTAGIALIVFVTLILVIYGSQFAWEVANVTYRDHRTLVGMNDSLRNAHSDFVDPTSRDAEITRLKSQLATYQKAYAPGVKVFPISHDSKPGVPKMEYMLTTGTIRTPVNLTVSCDFPVTSASIVPMTTSGGTMSTGSDRRLSANSFTVSLQSPAWSPSGPLWVTVLFVPPVDRMPVCSFRAE